MYTYEHDGFPGHPANGKHGPSLETVVVPGVETPAHSEVGDLDLIVVSNEAVATGQIPMDDIQTLEVLHPRGHLHRHVDQTAVARRCMTRTTQVGFKRIKCIQRVTHHIPLLRLNTIVIANNQLKVMMMMTTTMMTMSMVMVVVVVVVWVV